MTHLMSPAMVVGKGAPEAQVPDKKAEKRMERKRRPYRARRVVRIWVKQELYIWPCHKPPSLLILYISRYLETSASAHRIHNSEIADTCRIKWTRFARLIP